MFLYLLFSFCFVDDVSELDDADLLQLDDADLLQLDDADLLQLDDADLLTEPEDNNEHDNSSKSHKPSSAGASASEGGVSSSITHMKPVPSSAAAAGPMSSLALPTTPRASATASGGGVSSSAPHMKPAPSRGGGMSAAAIGPMSSLALPATPRAHEDDEASGNDESFSSSASHRVDQVVEDVAASTHSDDGLISMGEIDDLCALMDSEKSSKASQPVTSSQNTTSTSTAGMEAGLLSIDEVGSLFDEGSVSSAHRAKLLPKKRKSLESPVSDAELLCFDEISSMCDNESESGEQVKIFAPPMLTTTDQACEDIIREMGGDEDADGDDSHSDFGVEDADVTADFVSTPEPEPGALKSFLRMCHEVDNQENVEGDDDMLSIGEISDELNESEKDSESVGELPRTGSSRGGGESEQHDASSVSSATLTPDSLALLDAQTGATTRASLFRDKYIAEKEAEVNNAKQKEVVQTFFGTRLTKRKAAHEPPLSSHVQKKLKKARTEIEEAKLREEREKLKSLRKNSHALRSNRSLSALSTNSLKDRSPLLAPVGIGLVVAPKPQEEHSASDSGSPASSAIDPLAPLTFEVAMKGLELWSEMFEPELVVPLEADLLAAPKPPPLPPQPSQAPPLPCSPKSAAKPRRRYHRRKRRAVESESSTAKRRKRGALPPVPHDWPVPSEGTTTTTGAELSELAARKCASDLLCSHSSKVAKTSQNSELVSESVSSPHNPPTPSLPPPSNHPDASSNPIESAQGTPPDPRGGASESSSPPQEHQAHPMSNTPSIHYPILISTRVPEHNIANLDIILTDSVKAMFPPGQPFFECLRCRKRHTELASLIQHMSRTHVQTIRYGCPHRLCTKSFTQVSHVRRHVRSSHRGEKRWRCDGCLKRFSENSSRLTHQKLRFDKCVRAAHDLESEWREFLRKSTLVPLCVRQGVKKKTTVEKLASHCK